MSWPVTLPERRTGPGLPEQGLSACEACEAINLPGSNYCCACGLPLPGGALDATTRAEIEELVRQAREGASGGPISAEEGASFRSRVLIGTVSCWPAALASPQFITDAWAGVANFQHARVLLIERLDMPLGTLLPLLESVANLQQILVLVSGQFSGEILTTLTANAIRNTLRTMPLVLTLPAASHPVLLGDIAAVLRTKVVLAKALPKLKADALPTVPAILADESRSWAVGISAPAMPALEGDPAVVAARRNIYEQAGARIELGANSRSTIETRRRYACKLLREEPPAARPTPTGLVAAPGQEIREP
jgi:hypothetical protein